MGDAMPLPSDTLNLLLEILREQGPYIYATPGDANFFRKQGKPPVKKSAISTLIEKTEVPPLRVEAAKVEVKVQEAKPVQELTVKEEEFLQPKLNFSLVRDTLSRVAPELAIIQEIPSDITAQRIAERWKTKNQSAPISILSFQEPPEQRALLEQIAKALDVYFGPAKIVHAEEIERETQWEAFLSVSDLKMVIACDYTLWQLSGLMHFYKETPAQGTRALKNVPLFLLPDLSLYLKDPLLKRSLWKALCQKFS